MRAQASSPSESTSLRGRSISFDRIWNLLLCAAKWESLPPLPRRIFHWQLPRWSQKLRSSTSWIPVSKNRWKTYDCNHLPRLSLYPLSFLGWFASSTASIASFGVVFLFGCPAQGKAWRLYPGFSPARFSPNLLRYWSKASFSSLEGPFSSFVEAGESSTSLVDSAEASQVCSPSLVESTETSWQHAIIAGPIHLPETLYLLAAFTSRPAGWFYVMGVFMWFYLLQDSHSNTLCFQNLQSDLTGTWFKSALSRSAITSPSFCVAGICINRSSQVTWFICRAKEVKHQLQCKSRSLPFKFTVTQPFLGPEPHTNSYCRRPSCQLNSWWCVTWTPHPNQLVDPGVPCGM